MVHRLLDEIDRVRGKDKNAQVFSLNQVREMEYMHAALSETLRLHPPVPLQQRRSVEDDVLPDGTKVIRTFVVSNIH
ncbi:cytochrome P450, partial [Mycobacterium tuberculosis]|uniref:cytochrome P450 n=1 Tax=Mycobacterium tuberculosis TaxID=1773 RepID=UPI003C6E75DB